jgi:hypothetical protein
MIHDVQQCITLLNIMRITKMSNGPKQPGRVVKNLSFARKFIGRKLPPVLVEQLRHLSRSFVLSLENGDLLLLNGSCYVTHTGLLSVAARRGCCGIEVQSIPELSDAAKSKYTFRAIVYKSRGCKGFVGYGDAEPSNVSELVHGAEMRVAETRAVNRALRKAYGIGICSVDEIGSSVGLERFQEPKKTPPQPSNGNYGGPKVRDRLCQLIRKHNLNATLVKCYATDFCAVKSLRDATREQVENFVEHLADWADKDRNALLCQLNSYLPGKEKEGAA